MGPAAAAAMCVLGACAAKKPAPRGAAPATPAAGQLPPGPDAPARVALDMPSLDMPWTLPVMTAGDVDALGRTLQAHETIKIRAGSRFATPAGETRTLDLVKALSPATRVVARGEGMLTSIMKERGELPLRRRPVPDGQRDLLGRPTYVWEDVPLSSDWMGPKSLLSGAQAVLAIDDAEIDLQAWRSLQAHAVGTCDAPMVALARGQEQALATLEPFLDHADAILWQVYAAELRTFVPQLVSELAPYEKLKTRTQFEDGASWDQYQCGHAYWEYMQNYARCGETPGTCAAAPRIFLVGEARIGSAEPSSFIPDDCAPLVGRDYVQEARRLSREAAQVATESFDPAWMALAARAGAITDVYDVLEDACVPRRRRIAEPDMAEARRRLGRIGERFNEAEVVQSAGRWVLEDNQFHVPGIGGVRQVARFAVEPGAVAGEIRTAASELSAFLAARTVCRYGPEHPPVAAVVVDVGSSEVEFVGYFFEEELLCPGLPPLRTPGDPAAAPATSEPDSASDPGADAGSGTPPKGDDG